MAFLKSAEPCQCVLGFGEMLNPACRKAPVCALGSIPASQIFIPRFSLLLFLKEAQIRVWA